MKQMFLDCLNPPPEPIKQSKNHHVYVAPNGCRITMSDTVVLYEDGQEPYKQIFADIKEAYENFKYWCGVEEKTCKKARR